MSETIDRRQQKTRAALHDAFRELVLGEGYDKLTIGAVASLANVGRSTFYEHYRTKDDLLRATIQAPFGALAGLAAQGQSADTRKAALRGVLLHFREQQLARVLLRWSTRPVLAAALAERIAAGVPTVTMQKPLLPLELMARQIADMQLAVVEAWIAGRPALDIEAAVDGLYDSTQALVQALYPPGPAVRP